MRKVLSKYIKPHHKLLRFALQLSRQNFWGTFGLNFRPVLPNPVFFFAQSGSIKRMMRDNARTFTTHTTSSAVADDVIMLDPFLFASGDVMISWRLG